MGSQPNSKDPQPQSLWKSMVNKLLGPDTAAPIKPLNEPLDLDGLDLDLLPPDKPKAAAVPSSPARPAKTPPDLADVTFDSEPEPDVRAAGPVAEEPAEVFFSDDEDAVDDDLVAPAAAEVAPEEPAGDSYWNALAELDADAAVDEPSAAPRGGRGGRGGPGRGDRRGGGRGSDRGESRREGSRRERGPREERPERGEKSESRGEKKESRGERSGRSREEGRSRPASRPAPVSPELFSDDDFGAGLTEESRAQIEASEAAAEVDFDSPEEGTEATPRPRRRRGRRGRRGRGRERTEAAAPGEVASEPEAISDSDVSFDVEFDNDAPPARGPRARGGREAPVPEDKTINFDVPGEEDDSFGAGLAGRPRRAEPEAEEPTRGRGRSRSPRGGRSRERIPEPVAPVESDDDVESVRRADDEADEAAIEEHRDKYRNIPTWEEAISYLVKPKHRSSGRSGGGRSRGSRGH